MAKNLQAVLVRLEPHVKAQLQEEARTQMRAVSNLIARILVDHCEQNRKPAKPHINGADHKSKARATV